MLYNKLFTMGHDGIACKVQKRKESQAQNGPRIKVISHFALQPPQVSLTSLGFSSSAYPRSLRVSETLLPIYFLQNRKPSNFEAIFRAGPNLIMKLKMVEETGAACLKG